MATTKQRLALSIINFLNNSLKDGTLTEEDRESVEVAQTCISDVFKLDPSDKTLEDSQTLLQIYSVYEKLKSNQSSLKSTTKNATTTPSSTTTSATTENPPIIPSDEQKKAAEELKSQGNSAMSKKDYQTAIELYTKAIEIIPGNPIFLSNRAAAYSASKDHKSACADAEAAVAIDPTYTKAWSRLGLARFALGDHKGSKEAYERGIEYEGNGGSDAMKKGFETASKRISDNELGEDVKERSVSDNPTAGAGSGGMPDLASLAGMFGGGGAGGSGGGLPDLSSIMNNPMFANMAKNLMSNPGALNNLMSNPRVADLMGQFGGSGGNRDGGSGAMPDLSSLMQDPNIADMASKFLGGAGRGKGQ